VTRTPSPCIRVCKLSADGHCIGCGRLPDEIRHWDDASDRERQYIVREAKRRLKPQQ